MMMMSLAAAAAATRGRLIGADREFEAVSTDSRQIAAGQLFVALAGERFDAHDFLVDVAARGAAGAIVAAGRLDSLAGLDLPLIAVTDPRLALGDLAADWRRRFDLPLIAVTGSNGKTTTKEMIAAILAAAARRQGLGADAVLSTRGNLNNDIGLPLTLLGLRGQHRYGVVEMGMNHPAEIGYLTRIARPTVALVTNAQRAHLAGMGDLLEVAAEKGTIYAGLTADGVAVVNADDGYADYWCEVNAGRHVLTFGLDRPADVRGVCRIHGLETMLALAFGGVEIEIQLSAPGRHNARNALAAAAATLAAGIPGDAVVEGLRAFAGVKGRLQRRAMANGAVLLDDTYNANPDSVRAGIDVLAATVGRKVLVLGDMGEIGDMSGQFHDEVGGYAKSQGVDYLFALGELSALAARNFGDGAFHYKTPEALVEAVRPFLTPDATVLVKGSRFMRMERVADALVSDADGQKENP